jgi:hypothetical protein
LGVMLRCRRLSLTAILPDRRPTHTHSLLDPRPVFFDPAVDRRLVAFGSPALGPLHGPAQPMVQQRPHPGGMVADPGEALDYGGDTVKGPLR